jgi:hypothetical protein
LRTQPCLTSSEAEGPAYWFSEDGTLRQAEPVHKGHRHSQWLHLYCQPPTMVEQLCNLKFPSATMQLGSQDDAQNLSPELSRWLLSDASNRVQQAQQSRSPSFAIRSMRRTSKQAESSTQTSPESGIAWDLPTRPMTAPSQTGLKWLTAPRR